MFNLLDQAMSSRERIPDVICAGHVHDYQRFALDASQVGGKGTIAYVAAGSAGYHNLHSLAADVKAAGVSTVFPTEPALPSTKPTTPTTATADSAYEQDIRVQFVPISPVPGVVRAQSARKSKTK